MKTSPFPKGKGMFDNVKGKFTCWLGFSFALLLLLLPRSKSTVSLVFLRICVLGLTEKNIIIIAIIKNIKISRKIYVSMQFRSSFFKV